MSQPGQIHRPVAQARHEPMGLLLVAEEEVLRVRARKGPSERSSFLHREDRRVRRVFVRDLQVLESGEEIVGAGRGRAVDEAGTGV